MGDGDAGSGRHGGERRDARDHLEGHAGPRERDRLLPAAPEHVRVAALQPHDAPPAAGMCDEERVHVRLG